MLNHLKNVESPYLDLKTGILIFSWKTTDIFLINAKITLKEVCNDFVKFVGVFFFNKKIQDFNRTSHKIK